MIHKPRTGRLYWKTLFFALPLILTLAACSTGKTNTVAVKTTAKATSSPAATVAPTQQPVSPISKITPIAGDYSLYVDQTYGYSFIYPSNWLVYPSTGQTPPSASKESNVAIIPPYTDSEVTPLMTLMVRATNDFSAQYVQQFICSGMTKTATVKGIPAVNMFTRGGDPVNGYSAAILGRVFIDKGIAFQILLEASPKASIHITDFVQQETPVFNTVLDSFNPGNGAATVNPC